MMSLCHFRMEGNDEAALVLDGLAFESTSVRISLNKKASAEDKCLKIKLDERLNHLHKNIRHKCKNSLGDSKTLQKKYE